MEATRGEPSLLLARDELDAERTFQPVEPHPDRLTPLRHRRVRDVREVEDEPVPAVPHGDPEGRDLSNERHRDHPLDALLLDLPHRLLLAAVTRTSERPGAPRSGAAVDKLKWRWARLPAAAV